MDPALGPGPGKMAFTSSTVTIAEDGPPAGVWAPATATVVRLMAIAMTQDSVTVHRVERTIRPPF